MCMYVTGTACFPQQLHVFIIFELHCVHNHIDCVQPEHKKCASIVCRSPSTTITATTRCAQLHLFRLQYPTHAININSLYPKEMHVSNEISLLPIYMRVENGPNWHDNYGRPLVYYIPRIIRTIPFMIVSITFFSSDSLSVGYVSMSRFFRYFTWYLTNFVRICRFRHRCLCRSSSLNICGNFQTKQKTQRLSLKEQV